MLEWINTRIMNANRGTNYTHHELSIKKKLEKEEKQKQKEEKEKQKEKKIKLTPY